MVGNTSRLLRAPRRPHLAYWTAFPKTELDKGRRPYFMISVPNCFQHYRIEEHRTLKILPFLPWKRLRLMVTIVLCQIMSISWALSLQSLCQETG